MKRSRLFPFLLTTTSFCIVIASCVVVVTGLVVAFTMTRVTVQNHGYSDAGPGSVYIPGAGFAGFWYHFGYFSHQFGYEKHYSHQHSNHSNIMNGFYDDANPSFDNFIDTSSNMTIYCYSSGCLSYVLAAASVQVDKVLQAAEHVQQSWLKNKIHRYEVVPNFLQDVIPVSHLVEQQLMRTTNETNLTQLSNNNFASSKWNEILAPLRILVTAIETPSRTISTKNQMKVSHNVRTPTNYKSLVQYLQQTTHIPWLTGPIQTQQPIYNDNSDITSIIVDGGFSRWLHPVCNLRVDVPITWTTMIHSLNPGLHPSTAKELFYRGMTDAAAALRKTTSASTTVSQF